MSIPKYRVDRLIVHALTGGLSGSSPDQLLLNKKEVMLCLKLRLKKYKNTMKCTLMASSSVLATVMRLDKP